MAIMTLIMALLLAMLSSIQRQTTRSTANIEAFRAARTAFETITRRVSQATLNAYWGYDDPETPTKYQRISELRFLSGNSADLIGAMDPNEPEEERFGHALFFNAPFGHVEEDGLNAGLGAMHSLLNTWGYYVELNTDQDQLPPQLNLTPRKRFRLMEMREPAEELSVYDTTSGEPNNISREWMQKPMGESARQKILGENILVMTILPKLSQKDDETGLNLVSSGSSFLYDSALEGQGIVNPFFSSKHQLPPLLQITLVAIDDASARQLETNPEFDTFLGKLADFFVVPEDYDSDLQALEDLLTEMRVNYRVFSTEIQIQASKWSVE